MCQKISWKDLKRSVRVLKCIYAWNITLFCIKTKTVRIYRNQPSLPCFKPLKLCMVAPSPLSSLLHCTCRMLIGPNVAVAVRRNLFRLWSQRSVVDIKDINILNPICLQTDTLHERAIGTKGRQTNCTIESTQRSGN